MTVTLDPATATPAEFAEVVSRVQGKARVELLRRRYAHRVAEFARAMWPDRFSMPYTDFHRHLFDLQAQYPGTKTRRRDVWLATAGPRGYSKSTITSFAEIAHDIVYAREDYIVLLSATQRLSRSLSRDLLNAFKDTKSPLARLYGPFTVTGGVEEWEVSVRRRPSVGVLARSFGTEVRGAKHPTRGIRPTKVVIDDGEKKDRVRNPEQRAIWMEALQKDVLKLGRAEGGVLVKVVGTVLHPESMLATLLEDPGWKSSVWKAIIKWPERTDLWEECRRIWADLSLGKQRRTAAFAFYRARQTLMEAGSQLLAPEGRSLFELYEMIWSQGLGSFLSEMQNEPRDPTAAIFLSERFARFTRIEDRLRIHGKTERYVPIADLRLHLHWDPSVGGQDGDFGAVVVLGRDRWGYTYVLDAWMARAPISAQVEAVWTLAERWRCTRGTVEAVGFQTLLADAWPRMKRERADAGRWSFLQLAPRGENQNKEERISTMEPDITHGWMLFADGIDRLVLGQFDAFPGGDHDDAPDAICAAWRVLGGSPAGMVQ